MGYRSFGVPEETHDQLEQIKRDLGVPMSRTVAFLVDDYYRRHHEGVAGDYAQKAPQKEPPGEPDGRRDELGTTQIEKHMDESDIQVTGAKAAFKL